MAVARPVMAVVGQAADALVVEVRIRLVVCCSISGLFGFVRVAVCTREREVIT